MKNPFRSANEAWGFCLLTILAFLGNYFSMQLFSGVDFIFGSIFIFIIIHYYGTKHAAAAAALSGIYVWFLWDNPYGFFTLILEAWLVGCYYHRMKRNLMAGGILFLLLVGMPLSFFTSTVLLQLDLLNSVLIMLKQGVNSLFNVLIAHLAILLIGSILRSKSPLQVSFQEILFNLLLLFFLTPLLSFLVYIGNGEIEKVKKDIEERIDDTANALIIQMNNLYHRHAAPLTGVANSLGVAENTRSNSLQSDLLMVQQSFPSFKIVYVTDERGEVAAKQSRYALRDYPLHSLLYPFQQTVTGPFLSNVFAANRPPLTPFVALSVPIEKQGFFKGHVVGYIKPVTFLQTIQETVKGSTKVTFVDQQGHVIVSNDQKQQTMKPIIHKDDVLSFDRLNSADIDDHIPHLWKWTDFSYSRQVRISSEVPWNIHIEVPVSDYKHELYEKYIGLLFAAFLFSTVALLCSYMLSYWIQKSLKQVAALTTNLPEKIQRSEKIDWPRTFITEITSIIENFKSTENKLQNMFSEVVEAHKHLEYLAHYDPLTNVYNRTYVLNAFKEMAAASSFHSSIAVFFIDLDRFKIVNDTLGHQAGDTLLIEVSERLKQVCTGPHIISRLGGDEFMILIPELKDSKEVEELAEEMVLALSDPYYLKGGEYHLTASIGISMYPEDGDDIHTLIKNADLAMYAAKEKGKDNYQFYDQSIQQFILKKVQMENELRHAIERQELQLYYQPQIDLKTGKIIGAEALLRWIHPTLGVVSPADFIPIAEETGLIIEIGEWVLKTACHEAKSWHRAGWNSMNVSVNISMKQFMHDHLLFSITTALAESGLDAGYLKVEITESIAMSQPELVQEKLGQLKALGVELALDDFGTGYSSLHYLKNLPVDFLKIDRSFIQDIDAKQDDVAIVKALVEMAHSLGMTVVAEGVESKHQQQTLQDIHCDQLQGFVFSRPLPGSELPQLFEANLLVGATSSSQI
jgi:diguanylate cyclase (GGDEF)-like protein